MLVIFTVFFSAFAFSFRSATVPKQTDSGQKSLIGAGVFRAYSVLSASMLLSCSARLWLYRQREQCMI